MDAPPARDRPPLAVQLAFVVAVAVLSVLTAFAGRGPFPSGALLVVDLVVAAVGSAAILPLIRTRPPVPVALGLAVLAALTPAATPAATAGALRIARTRPLPTAAAVAAFGTAAHALRYAWRPEGVSFGWWLLLAAVAHAALLGWGAYGRSRAALLETLRERARRAEAEQGRRVAEARSAERARIAREMHDVLAHRLSLLAATAGAVEYRPDAPPERIAAAAGVLRAGAHAALQELREVIGVLRAWPDDDRPPPTTADLPRLVDEVRAAGVEVAFHDGLGAVLEGSTGRTVYRVVQEGLTNARKHAAGRPVEVRLTGGPAVGADITVEVTNPVGPAAGTPGSGTGLIGLAERVGLAGGRLEHGPVDGCFRLVATLPAPSGERP
jgi:signal transduction histidine kinase